MLKIDRGKQVALARIAAALGKEFAEVSGIMEDFKDELDTVFERIDGLRDQAHEIMDGEASDAEGYYYDKSEKWQEGDRGSAYSEWKDRLREIADAIAEAVERPDLPEVETPEWVEAIENQDFIEFEF